MPTSEVEEIVQTPISSIPKIIARKQRKYGLDQPYLTETTPLKFKQQEAEGNVQVLEAIDEFLYGKLPTNEQIKSLLDKVQGWRESRKLSCSGLVLVHDFKLLTRSLEQALIKKNSKQEFQQLVYHLRSVAANLPEQERLVNLSDLWIIVKLLVTSQDFRSILKEVNQVLQDCMQGISLEKHEPIDSFGKPIEPFHANVVAENLQLVLLKIHKSAQYKTAFKVLVKTMKQILKTGVSVCEELVEDADYKAAVKFLSMILENWSDKPVEPVAESLNRFNQHANQDPGLESLFRETRHFYVKSLKSLSFVENAQFVPKAADLIQSYRKIVQETYKTDAETLLDQFNQLVNGVKSDQLSKEIMISVSELTRDLVFDENGSYTFKTELFTDIAKVWIPRLVNAVKFIPITRFEHQDEMYHLVMSDIAISTKNIFPNWIEINSKNKGLFGFIRNSKTTIRNDICFNFYQIHLNAEQVPFYFEKKSGFMKMAESGVANLRIANQGLCVFVKVSIDNESSTRSLIVRQVKAWIDHLDLKVTGTTRDFGFNLFSPFINSMLKKKIANQVELLVLDQLSQLDAYLTSIKKQYPSHEKRAESVFAARQAPRKERLVATRAPWTSKN